MSASSSITRILPLGEETVGSSAAAISGIHRLPLCVPGACRRLRPWKREVETGTAAGAAENFDRTAMFLHDTVADREPEARPLARGFGGEEGIVNAMKVLRCYAVAGVDDFHARAAVFGRCRHFEHAAGLHGVAGVQKQVEKHLLQLARVTVNRRKRGVEMRADLDAGFLDLMLHERQ